MYHEYPSGQVHRTTQKSSARIIILEWSSTYQEARAELEGMIGKEETYLYCRTLPVRTIMDEAAYEAALRAKIAELKGGVQ